MDGDERSFRARAVEFLTRRLGTPLELRTESGLIFRWVLERPHRLSIYVTVDAPELPNMLHVMVSDPSSSAVDPVSATTVRTIEEVDSLVERILLQWRGGSAADVGTAPTGQVRTSLSGRDNH